jgi:hypothetical protein
VKLNRFSKAQNVFDKWFILAIKQKRGVFTMSKSVVPEAKEALERFKMEAASEVGVNLKQGYNGDLTSKQAGSVGGQMVNIMTTVRQKNYKRTDWTQKRQEYTITYEYSLAI